MKNDEVQKNTISRESDMFRRMWFKPWRRRYELGEREARGLPGRGNRACAECSGQGDKEPAPQEATQAA